MQGNLSGFDANQVKPLESFELLPAGWYQVIITDSAMKPTKNNDGEFLELVFTVIEGEHEGRKIWDRLNLNNANQTAVEIAQRALSAICRSVGVMTPSDSTELHDRPLEIKVSVTPPKKDEEGDVKFQAKNEVKGYRALGEAGVGAAAASGGTANRGRAPAGAATTTAPAKATPPWKRAAGK